MTAKQKEVLEIPAECEFGKGVNASYFNPSQRRVFGSMIGKGWTDSIGCGSLTVARITAEGRSALGNENIPVEVTT